MKKNDKEIVTMFGAFWWIRQVLLVLAGLFFLLFGVVILIFSYDLTDPFSFIMTFFASNLIILISGAMLVGFVFRMRRVYMQSREKGE